MAVDKSIKTYRFKKIAMYSGIGLVLAASAAGMATGIIFSTQKHPILKGADLAAGKYLQTNEVRFNDEPKYIEMWTPNHKWNPDFYKAFEQPFALQINNPNSKGFLFTTHGFVVFNRDRKQDSIIAKSLGFLPTKFSLQSKSSSENSTLLREVSNILKLQPSTYSLGRTVYVDITSTPGDSDFGGKTAINSNLSIGSDYGKQEFISVNYILMNIINKFLYSNVSLSDDMNDKLTNNQKLANRMFLYSSPTESLSKTKNALKRLLSIDKTEFNKWLNSKIDLNGKTMSFKAYLKTSLPIEIAYQIVQKRYDTYMSVFFDQSKRVTTKATNPEDHKLIDGYKQRINIKAINSGLKNSMFLQANKTLANAIKRLGTSEGDGRGTRKFDFTDPTTYENISIQGFKNSSTSFNNLGKPIKDKTKGYKSQGTAFPSLLQKQRSWRVLADRLFVKKNIIGLKVAAYNSSPTNEGNIFLTSTNAYHNFKTIIEDIQSNQNSKNKSLLFSGPNESQPSSRDLKSYVFDDSTKTFSGKINLPMIYYQMAINGINQGLTKTEIIEMCLKTSLTIYSPLNFNTRQKAMKVNNKVITKSLLTLQTNTNLKLIMDLIFREITTNPTQENLTLKSLYNGKSNSASFRLLINKFKQNNSNHNLDDHFTIETIKSITNDVAYLYEINDQTGNYKVIKNVPRISIGTIRGQGYYSEVGTLSRKIALLLLVATFKIDPEKYQYSPMYIEAINQLESAGKKIFKANGNFTNEIQSDIKVLMNYISNEGNIITPGSLLPPKQGKTTVVGYTLTGTSNEEISKIKIGNNVLKTIQITHKNFVLKRPGVIGFETTSKEYLTKPFNVGSYDNSLLMNKPGAAVTKKLIKFYDSHNKQIILHNSNIGSRQLFDIIGGSPITTVLAPFLVTKEKNEIYLEIFKNRKGI